MEFQEKLNQISNYYHFHNKYGWNHEDIPLSKNADNTSNSTDQYDTEHSIVEAIALRGDNTQSYSGLKMQMTLPMLI